MTKSHFFIIKIIVFLMLCLNLFGLLLVYSESYKNDDFNNLLDFLPFASRTYSSARTALFWVSLAVLALSWFFWELLTTKRRRKYHAILAIAFLIIVLFLVPNLIGIISSLFCIGLIILYTIFRKEFNNKDFDVEKII